MDCKVQKNNKNGKINGILNKEGKPSELFQQIFNTPVLSMNESIEIYKNVYADKIQDKVMFQIVGEKAAQNLDQADEVTTRIDNLQIAKEMEKLNKSPQEIRLATGWERGGEKLDIFAKTDDEILAILESNNAVTKIDC
jgi:lysine/ornithine N-monooxygenase